MEKNRDQYLCSEAEAGRDVFVRHPDTNEEGIVTSCVLKTEHMIVKTPQGEKRCWDFHECQDLTDPRSRPIL